MTRSLLSKAFALAISLAPLYSTFAQADNVDIIIKQAMDKRAIPGLQLAVVQQQKIIKLASYGYADLANKVAANDDTLFAINSMTKAFTGVALMQLVEQGKLKLSDPLGKHLPQMPLKWHPVTIAQLASHQSGLPDVMDEWANLINHKGWHASWQQTLTAELETTPGRQFRYNQTNYVLLGMLIDKYAEMPFIEFIDQQQLDKVNMPRTKAAGFGHYSTVINNMAVGYSNINSDSLFKVCETFAPPSRTAAGMSTTAKELANWVIALKGGKLLNQQSLEALFSPIPLNNGKTDGFGGPLNGYAIGWPMVVNPEQPIALAIGGGRVAMAVYQNQDLSIIILTNLQGAFPERLLGDLAKHYSQTSN